MHRNPNKTSGRHHHSQRQPRGDSTTYEISHTTLVGYLAIEAIPTDWVTAYLGGDSLLSVPLAALIGIPAYINTEASLPLVSTLWMVGWEPDLRWHFLVTGASTSVGAITGLFVIARARVVGLVVASLLVGAVTMGWIAQVAL